jgi:hypothetical protein
MEYHYSKNFPMSAIKPALPNEPLITVSLHAFVIDELGEPGPTCRHTPRMLLVSKG